MNKIINILFFLILSLLFISCEDIDLSNTSCHDSNECPTGYYCNIDRCKKAENSEGDKICNLEGGNYCNSEGGTCLSTTGEHQCNCNEGYTGKRCFDCKDGYIKGLNNTCSSEITDSCDPNPCTDTNKTVCTDDNGTAVCSCDQGYIEDESGNCIEDINNPCDPNPCTETNKTVCTDDNGTAVCSCDNGYIDDGSGNCIEDINNPCDPNPCTEANRTICISNGESYTCECDIDHILENSYCINSKIVDCVDIAPENGTSTITGVEITYTTENGWTDPESCQWSCNEGYEEINEACEQLDPCDPNPCTENNKTICTSNGENYTCSCDTDYTLEGDQCINLKTVDCNDLAPTHATSNIIEVDITYTTENGWTDPANCEWSCDVDYTLYNNECRKLGIFVSEWSGNGDMGGIYGADEICNTDSNPARDPSRYYKALIGSENRDYMPNSLDWPLLASTSYYRANDKSTKIGTTTSDRRFNIEGGDKLNNSFTDIRYNVWTGLDGNGEVPLWMYDNCNNWRNSIDNPNIYTDNTTKGFSDVINNGNYDYQAISYGAICNENNHLYCVEMICPEGYKGDNCDQCDFNYLENQNGLCTKNLCYNNNCTENSSCNFLIDEARYECICNEGYIETSDQLCIKEKYFSLIETDNIINITQIKKYLSKLYTISNYEKLDSTNSITISNINSDNINITNNYLKGKILTVFSNNNELLWNYNLPSSYQNEKLSVTNEEDIVIADKLTDFWTPSGLNGYNFITENFCTTTDATTLNSDCKKSINNSDDIYLLKLNPSADPIYTQIIIDETGEYKILNLETDQNGNSYLLIAGEGNFCINNDIDCYGSATLSAYLIQIKNNGSLGFVELITNIEQPVENPEGHKTILEVKNSFMSNEFIIAISILELDRNKLFVICKDGADSYIKYEKEILLDEEEIFQVIDLYPDRFLNGDSEYENKLYVVANYKGDIPLKTGINLDSLNLQSIIIELKSYYNGSKYIIDPQSHKELMHENYPLIINDSILEIINNNKYFYLTGSNNNKYYLSKFNYSIENDQYYNFLDINLSETSITKGFKLFKNNNNILILGEYNNFDPDISQFFIKKVEDSGTNFIDKDLLIIESNSTTPPNDKYTIFVDQIEDYIRVIGGFNTDINYGKYQETLNLIPNNTPKGFIWWQSYQ